MTVQSTEELFLGGVRSARRIWVESNPSNPSKAARIFAFPLDGSVDGLPNRQFGALFRAGACGFLVLRAWTSLSFKVVGA